MQKKRRISLNAIRTFTLVARRGALTEAAGDIGISASAVSHQIRKLEDELGVQLFRRGNNSIALTEAGTRFFEEVSPAVALIEHASDALHQNENQIIVNVSLSLAVRWLIPALERFHTLYPAARVRVETTVATELDKTSVADVAIHYIRAGTAARPGEELVPDFSQAVVAPALLKSSGYEKLSDLHRIPALKCTKDNWDWKRWCEAAGMPYGDIDVRHEFDTDDAALHAVTAGLGMVLATPLLIGAELGSGSLVTVPGSPAVELGHYALTISRRERRAVRQFCAWLRADIMRQTSWPT